jgi:hypothetical protein
MKLNSINSIFQGIGLRHSVIVLAFLMLVNFAIGSSLAQKNSQKRITSVQLGELAEGSRVTVFSDSALNDYEAFRRGDRFYVRIPLADFAASQPNFRGDGFDDVQVQRSGDSILISFKLQLGANARVDQRSNRLDVIFSAPNSAASKVGRSSSTNQLARRTTTNAIPGIVVLQNSRNGKRNPDAAGPMPPASPIANRPRFVTEEFIPTRPAPTQPSRSTYVKAAPNQGSVNRVHNRTAVETPPAEPVASSARANDVKPTPNSDLPSSVTPTSTPGYTTSTIAQSTPWPSRTVASSPSTTSSAGWKKRGELVMQWVSANRLAASFGAFVALSVIVFVVSMIHRKRRKHVKAGRVKVTGVKPKNSPANNPEESMANPNAVYDDMLFDDYVSDMNQPEVTLPSAAVNFSQSTNGDREWAREGLEPEPAESRAAPVNQRWIPATQPIPSYTIKNEVPEREVFEL